MGTDGTDVHGCNYYPHRFADDVAQAVSLHAGLAACATGAYLCRYFVCTWPEPPGG